MHTLHIPDMSRKQTHFHRALCPLYSLLGSADLWRCYFRRIDHIKMTCPKKKKERKKKICFLQNIEKWLSRQLETAICANMDVKLKPSYNSHLKHLRLHLLKSEIPLLSGLKCQEAFLVHI